eukprot:TRINITY_DN922_c0_g1_i4.p2 TRINITY_DN922_c0_g1~~TRINITY_DN922_c0_g1_i4.p2  ORF type:complete len:151 (+),score=31.44 TRINITY_DN922_c0_g1_i4:58-510(+)
MCKAGKEVDVAEGVAAGWRVPLLCACGAMTWNEVGETVLVAPCVAADVDAVLLGTRGRDHTFLVDMLTAMLTVAVVFPPGVCCTAWVTLASSLTAQRGDIRKLHNIPGSRCGDCASSFLCPLCVTCQNWNQIEMDAIDMAKDVSQPAYAV